ncbi:hypothetical protein [Undibacterium fentianense]|uniref:Uncharacterized protein n=1 Tax=Undibacterium fentianense TaxID=2828728 RepID=A0A941E6H1_9BURK|nr:hypothetical protein [Undibacterium fentianense]MBR7800653.1 hypothetical protein [Undibacterium fentianense]
MQIPNDLIKLKSQIEQEVQTHFDSYAYEQTSLILDSTGPSFTKQYFMLNAIGMNGLSQLHEIHAFSGSTFALFGYFAFASGQHRVSLDALCHPDAEKIFRKQHHPQSLSGIRAICNLLVGRSAFPSIQPLLASLEYMFGDFVEQPFANFGTNIHIYMTKNSQLELLVLSNNDQCSPELHDLRLQPIKNIVAMAANVPFVYGGIQPNTPYSDPVYNPDYLPALKRIAQTDKQCLISTPWRAGKKGNRHYVKCYPAGNARWQMLKDFARLVSGRRNQTWSRDMYAAFKMNNH